MSQVEKKHILVFSSEHLKLLSQVLPSERFTLFENEGEEIDFTFIEKVEQIEEIKGQGILLGPSEDFSEHLMEKILAVIDPGIFQHEVGRTLLYRLLGESSSLGIESVFSRSEVDFKNFRLMDSLSVGHYTDVLAHSAYHHGMNSLRVRSYFDHILGFFEKMNQKVQKPYEVDFGVWKNVYVVQIHAPCEGVERSEILNDFKIFNIQDKNQGNLRNALAKTDALDIFYLKKSQRIALTAQWFDPQSLGQKIFYPSLLVHEIESFDELKPSFGQNTLKNAEKDNWPSGKRGELFEKVIDNIAHMDFSDFYQMVSGGDKNEGYDVSKVSGWLGIEEESFLVKGQQEDLGEESSWVEGEGADEKEQSFTVKGEQKDIGENQYKYIIPGSPQEEKLKEAWQIKRSEIVDNLKKQKSNAQESEHAQNLHPDEEISEVIKSNLNLEELEERFVVKDLLAQDLSDEVLSVKSPMQSSDQELIKKDAQIVKMKKLIDRMKNELIEMKNKAPFDEGLLEELKEKEIERLKEENEKLRLKKSSEREGPEEKGSDDLIKENEALRNQLDVSKKRISQMSERILDSKRGADEKLVKEVEQLKSLGERAQKKIVQMQTDNAQMEKRYRELEDEVSYLKRKLDELEKIGGEGSSASKSNENDEENSKKVKELKKAHETEVKELGLQVKKLEQKNRFIQAQLDSAQKKSGQSSQGSTLGGTPQSNDKKLKQFERMMDVMKDNETRLQDELLEKKEQIQKMKAESMILKNKVSELERKLQKYGRNAA